MPHRQNRDQCVHEDFDHEKVNSKTHIVDLENRVNVYLQCLKQKASNATYLSHKTALNKFVNHYRTHACVETTSVEKLVAQFIDKLLTTTTYSTSTITGYLCTLSNFLTYLSPRNPELVKATILLEMDSTTPQLHSIKSNIFPEVMTDCGSNSTHRARVEHLLSHLRGRQFGTRTHALLNLSSKQKAGRAPYDN